MEKNILILGISNMKTKFVKKNLQMIHRYACYANNNIFDAPNAISGYFAIPSRIQPGWNFRRDNCASVPDFIRFSLSIYIL